jgi:hypothetical protein
MIKTLFLVEATLPDQPSHSHYLGGRLLLEKMRRLSLPPAVGVWNENRFRQSL